MENKIKTDNNFYVKTYKTFLHEKYIFILSPYL